MAPKAGIWIDHQQAIVVLITDKGMKIEKVKLAVQKAVRSTGNSSPKKKYTPNDFIPEDRRERKVASERKKSYDDVLARTRGADSLLILGPGEAKGELCKQVKAKKMRGLALEVESADRMSEKQIVTRVNEHFAKSAAANSATRKKTGNPVPKNRTKKSGN